MDNIHNMQVLNLVPLHRTIAYSAWDESLCMNDGIATPGYVPTHWVHIKQLFKSYLVVYWLSLVCK